MREGTKSRTSTQISEALETMAATLAVNAGFAGPQASIVGSSLSEHFGQLFDLTADMLLNPAFSADEWTRLVARTKTGLTQQRANPGFLANETLQPRGLRLASGRPGVDALPPCSTP